MITEFMLLLALVLLINNGRREGGNIIIDTTDDVSQAKEVLSEFKRLIKIQLRQLYIHKPWRSCFWCL